MPFRVTFSLLYAPFFKHYSHCLPVHTALCCEESVASAALYGLFEVAVLDQSLSLACHLGLQDVPTLLVSVGRSESCLDGTLLCDRVTGSSTKFFHENTGTVWDFQEELATREGVGKRLGMKPTALAAARLYWGPVGYPWTNEMKAMDACSQGRAH